MADLSGTISVEHQLLVRTLVTGQFQGTVANHFAAASKEVFFPAGKTIYAQGTRSDCVYFVLEGRVELQTEGAEPWYLGRRSVFGVIDVELERDRSRTARAVTDLRALRLDAGDWLDLMEDHFELTPARIRMLSAGLLDLGLSLDPPGGFAEEENLGASPVAREVRASMIPSLPQRDGRELNPFERLITLRLCPSFARAGTQSLIRLSRAARPRLHAAGETIVERGTVSETFHVVVSGRVVARRDAPCFAVAFGPARLAGGYMGLGQERWAIDLVTKEPSCTLELRYDELFDVMEDHFDMVRAVMGFLASERERLQQLAAPR